MRRLAFLATPALLCTIVLSAFSTTARAWLPFGEARFKYEGLIDTGSLGLPKTGLVAAFGDYNGDQLLDLFHLSADQRTVVIYTWSREAYSWKEVPSTRIHTPSDFIVVNVVPGDWNYDGRMDVLLMGGKNPGGWWGEDETLDMVVHLGQADGSFGPALSVDSSTLAQPLVFDANGDMRGDLLGFAAASSKTLALWSNVWDSTNGSAVFEVKKPPLDLVSFSCTFPSPHFNGFVDLNGDCLADLFLVCQNGKDATSLSYQIYVNDKKGGFKLSQQGDLPRGTKSVSFADMDRDGTTDLVISSCTGSDCALSIAYNVQVPLCSGSPGQASPCRDPEDLCVADEGFKFQITPGEQGESFSWFPISMVLGDEHTLVTSSDAFRGDLPLPPAIGDFNIDGYPDLMVITRQSGQQRASLLESRPCDRRTCTPEQTAKGRRVMRPLTAGAEVLSTLLNVESATFVDVDDDGSLDLIIQRAIGTGAGREVHFIKNNYFHDAFFLKALVLNGACQGWCEPSAPGQKKYRPYGVSYSGASFKFTVLDPTGARKATQVGQLPQTSYLSLGTPYSYFGLGRTNNYVENLFIGSTRHQEQHYINIEGLIPNSQVVIVPYQPGASEDPSSWLRELWLKPGEWIPWVTIVLGAAILLLGAVVLALHLNEKREDELERRARLSQINFSAL